MLVGFLGAPLSGKTTVAARLFTELKDLGKPSEFIPEQARRYIGLKRGFLKKKGDLSPITLSDKEQLVIARRQFEEERDISFGSGDSVIVVTDSCALNSLLYMSPELRQTPEVKSLMAEALAQYDVLFICGLVMPSTGLDPNRLHTYSQSEALDEQLQDLVREFAPDKEIYRLSGLLKFRFQTALSVTLTEFTKC